MCGWCAGHKRWSPAHVHRRKSPSGRPGFWRWSCAGHQRNLSPAQLVQRIGAGVAPVWSAGHQRMCNFCTMRWFCAGHQRKLTSARGPYLMHFVKRPHSTYDLYIYMSMFFRSFLRVPKAYFSLRKYFKRKIIKNSPLNTQTISFDHQSSSRIIHDHLGFIHVWFCIITSFLVRF